YWELSAQAKVHCIITGYLLCQAAYFAWNESKQVLAIGMAMYLRSGWNVFDMLSILLVLIIMPCQLARTGTAMGSFLAPTTAFACVMTWFKLFFYALAFEPTGPVVHMVFQMAFAVIPWATLMFMNLVAFGSALIVLYQYTASDSSFAGFGNTMFTLWTAVFGVFDVSVNLYEGGWRQLALGFFSFFLFINN
ncbi:WD_REPEATS_REGION domain-containing protein, partial [Haematococcus lacustris]